MDHSKEDLRIRSRRREGKKAKVIFSENQFMSERILLIGDWYHRNASAMLKWYSSKKSNGWVRHIRYRHALNDVLRFRSLPRKRRFSMALTLSIAPVRVGLFTAMPRRVEGHRCL